MWKRILTIMRTAAPVLVGITAFNEFIYYAIGVHPLLWIYKQLIDML